MTVVTTEPKSLGLYFLRLRLFTSFPYTIDFFHIKTKAYSLDPYFQFLETIYKSLFC